MMGLRAGCWPGVSGLAGVFGFDTPVFGALLGSSGSTLGDSWRFEVPCFGTAVVTTSLLNGDDADESELCEVPKPSGDGAIGGGAVFFADVGDLGSPVL